MGFFAFIVLCFVVCAIAWLGVWLISYFIPGVPAIVPKIIWGVAIFIILMTLLRATGLLTYDPKIPGIWDFRSR